MTKFISTREAAERLCIPIRTLQHRLINGRYPGSRLCDCANKGWLIPEELIELEISKSTTNISDKSISAWNKLSNVGDKK